MRFLVNAQVFGWRMTGLMPYGAQWFLGFSRACRPDDGVRLVSYAPDGTTCTLNIDGVEHYYDLWGKSSDG